jgi:hypothetical protein
MVKTAKKPTTKKHATMMQGKSATQISPEALEEAITLAIKVHRRALKELEKH